MGIARTIVTGIADEAAYEALKAGAKKFMNGAGEVIRKEGPTAARIVGKAIHDRQELVKKWRSLVIGLIRYDLAQLGQGGEAASTALLANYSARCCWHKNRDRYVRTDENRFITGFALELMDHLGQWVAEVDPDAVRSYFSKTHILNVWMDRGLAGQDAIDADVDALNHDFYPDWASRLLVDEPNRVAQEIGNVFNEWADALRR